MLAVVDESKRDPPIRVSQFAHWLENLWERTKCISLSQSFDCPSDGSRRLLAKGSPVEVLVFGVDHSIPNSYHILGGRQHLRAADATVRQAD